MEVTAQTSVDGTQKFQFFLEDGEVIESVWIPETRRNTLCISSQVGCALKCAFCVTGVVGFKRNLKADEIVEQVRHVMLQLKLPVSNVVFMGMGEPLLNLDAVLEATSILMDPKGLAIGKRKITVSTAGVVPKIKEYFERSDINLAISITGATNQSRDRWMPINRTHNLQALVSQLKSIDMGRGRYFMFEVVLMRNENDQDQEAHELAELLKPLPAKVNLIPYNENPYFPKLKRPTDERVKIFQAILVEQGFDVRIRKNRGQDIQAACGQLAGKKRDIRRFRPLP